jgi:chaperonin cofactor prefoldin
MGQQSEDEVVERPHRSTNSDVVRRIERLEDSNVRVGQLLSELASKVELGTIERTHMKELLDARFGNVEANQKAVEAKIDSLMSMWQQAMQNPGSTGATKRILEEYEDFKTETRNNIKEVATTVKVNSDFLQQLRGLGLSLKILFGTSVLGTVLGLLSLLAVVQSGNK